MTTKMSSIIGAVLAAIVVYLHPVAPVALSSEPKAVPQPVVQSDAAHKDKRIYKPKRWAQGGWERFPPRVERFARCVAKHESWTAGLWTARNGSSTASGFAQWLDGTWRSHLRYAGLNGPSRAYLATPRKQARVMAWAVLHHQKFHWYGTGCYPGSPTW